MAGAQSGQLGSGLGLGGSVFSNGFPGFAAAATPGASTVPEGPVTITQSGFGVPSVGGASSSGKTILGLSMSTAALVLLAVIWWSLPK